MDLGAQGDTKMYKTIKGQAKSGDVDAAMNGLKNVLERSRHAKM